MEVLVGPTYSMEVSVSSPSPSPSPSSWVRDGSGVAAAKDKSMCLFLKEDRHEKNREKLGSGYGSDDCTDSSSSSSSTIGDPGDSEDENDDVSKLKKPTLSLDSLEDCLPIKRGLSNHYNGRSKSFANLSDVSSVKDLRKEENPFNKRRRLLIVNKLSRNCRRSSFYSWSNPISMPILPALEEEEDEEDRHHHPHQLQNLPSFKQQTMDDEEEQVLKNPPTKMLNGSGFNIGFKSKSCFSLADLQEEEEEEEEEGVNQW